MLSWSQLMPLSVGHPPAIILMFNIIIYININMNVNINMFISSINVCVYIYIYIYTHTYVSMYKLMSDVSSLMGTAFNSGLRISPLKYIQPHWFAVRRQRLSYACWP